MISKKDALTLVVLGIGGVTVASAFAGSDGGGEGGAVMEGLRGVKGRAGGILGGATPPSPTVYQFGAQPAVSFPKAPSFGLSSLFPAEKLVAPAPVERGTAGVSSAGKKRPAAPAPYIYTGGEVRAGAVSVAPWAMGRTTPAEMGVTTALSMARKPKKKKRIPSGGGGGGRRYSTPGRAAKPGGGIV